MAECTNCNLWPLGNNDVYCGWCGIKLTSYEVTLEPAVLFLGSPDTDIRLTVQNRGQTPIALRTLSVDQTWVDVPALDSHSPPLLPNAPPLVLHLDIQEHLLPSGERHTATICASAGDGIEPLYATLQVVPAPVLHIDIADYEIVLDDTPGPSHMGWVRLEKGYTHIATLEASEAWVELRAVPEQAWPCTLGLQHPEALRFEVVVHKSLLRDRLQQPSSPAAGRPMRQEVEVRVLCEEPQQIITGTFTVVYRWPPLLHVLGLHQGALHWQLFLGKRRTIALGVENRGGVKLELHQVETDGAVPWVHMAVSTAWPIVVPAGTTTDLAFTVDTTQVAAGRYQSAVTLLSSSYPTPQMTIPLVLEVQEMPVYKGVVAFDFGTTNSCAVVWDPQGYAARLVRMEEAHEATAISSAILYRRRLDAHTREYEVGFYAQVQAVLRHASVVQSIKRELGRRAPRRVQFSDDGQWDDLLPEEIAQDIIAWMLDKVETELGHQVEECVITHPSTFSPLQLAALKGVYTRCGVRISQMMHEPVAAALEYILSREQADGTYTLMVYDCGGGTTDITLIEVDDTLDAEGRRVMTPKIRGTGGRRRFGGEDVTEAVTRELGRQFNEWLDLKYGRHDLIRTDLRSIETLSDPEEQKLALDNYWELRTLAETLKIDLSNDPDPNPHRTDLSSRLTFLHEGQRQTETPVAELTGHRLNELIHDDVVSTLEIMQTLVDKAGIERPDIILLAGQSSRLRLVRELIEARFGEHGTQIVMPSDRSVGASAESGKAEDALKACVAMGACKAAWLLRMPSSIDLNDTEMLPMTTARIGIEAVTGRGEPYFKTVLDVGEPVSTWKPLTGVSIRRVGRITILENSVVDTNELDHLEIEELATFGLAQTLPADITDAQLRGAKMEMMLDEQHEVVLKITVGDQEYRLTATRWQTLGEEV